MSASAPASLLERPAVRRVQAALAAAGSENRIMALDSTARTAEDAARSIGCPLGAIVKSLVFLIDGCGVMVLLSGDRRCDTAALPDAFGLPGTVKRADADAVRALTGFSIGGVAPVGHPAPLPTLIDAGLRRFGRVYAAAGHPHCVFASDVGSLERLTGGRVSEAVAG